MDKYVRTSTVEPEAASRVDGSKFLHFLITTDL